MWVVDIYMPSRRAVIASSAIFLSGCTDSQLPDISSTPDPNEHVPDEWHETPARGLAGSVEAKIDIEGEVDYYPDREAVRISSDEYRPAGEYLRGRCPSIARRPVKELLQQRLDNPENVVGPRLFGADDEEPELRVLRKIVIDRDGNVISSPNIKFDTVRKATPENSIPTVILGEFEHTCRVPVFVEDWIEQYE